MSWVVVSKATGQAVCELFDQRNVARINRAAYDVIEIATYLASLNRRVEL